MERIYGNFQWAGLRVDTTGKTTPNNLGTDAYAMAVMLVDASGNPVTGGYDAEAIDANATTPIFAGPGIFHGITVGTPGVTSSAVIYDSTTGSGTVIATVDTTSAVSLVFDAHLETGLTVVTAGGTPADITITYRQS